jgi:hypothetical protein
LPITRGVALLPPLLLFGNSYMLTLETVGFHNYFSKTTRVLDYTDFNKVLDYVEDDTKIFILQTVRKPDSFSSAAYDHELLGSTGVQPAVAAWVPVCRQNGAVHAVVERGR